LVQATKYSEKWWLNHRKSWKTVVEMNPTKIVKKDGGLWWLIVFF
jgi:hypothetical protein